MDIGTRVGARTHTRRGGAKRSSRREAETCADGLSWHNRPYGETRGRSMWVREQDATITEEDASDRLFIRLER
jgi:hypothetical protein